MKAEYPSRPSLPENTHPYAVRVSLKLGSNIELGLKDDEECFPFAGECTLRIVSDYVNPREEANSFKRVSVNLEAFRSASEAERAGKVLALSLMWVAASKGVTIAFEKRTGDFPFAVRDRTRSRGVTVRAEGRAFSRIRPEEFSAIAEEAYKLGIDVAPYVLTSMEYYASAQLEMTERARFISLVIALEALSKQRDYGNDIAAVLKELASQLERSSLLAGEDGEPLRSSLSERLKQLRQESVRQAIVRTVSERVHDQDTIRFVDDAYGIRSKILHEGLNISDLSARTRRLEDVLRQIYSSILGLTLSRPLLQS